MGLLIGLPILKDREGKEGKRIRSLPDLKAEQAGNQSRRPNLTTYRKRYLRSSQKRALTKCKLQKMGTIG